MIVEDAVGSSDREAHDKALWVMKKLFTAMPTESVVARFKLR